MKKETQLYAPIKKYFEKRGYKVNAEAMHFDIVLSKEDELIIIETKLNFNMTLLYQAIDAQKVANFVYVAIPQTNFKKSKKIIQITKSLNLGLITVSEAGRINVELAHDDFVFKKVNNKKRKRLQKEIAGRHFDTNEGGSTRTKIMTAYKEKALQLATTLSITGEMKPSELVKKYECPADSRVVMYNNINGWFVRKGNGIYDITPVARVELKKQEYKEIVDFYLNKCYILDKNI